MKVFCAKPAEFFLFRAQENYYGVKEHLTRPETAVLLRAVPITVDPAILCISRRK